MRKIANFCVKIAQLLAILALPLAALAPVAAAGADGAGEAGEKIGRATGAPLPRFASVKRNPARFRQGPGLDYPILWELTRTGLPVQIISEHDHWRRVRLHDGSVGWIHKVLLSNRRMVLVRGPAPRPLYAEPNERAEIVAEVKDDTAPLRLRRCERDWCEAETENVRGWAPKRRLWGVEPDEIFD